MRTPYRHLASYAQAVTQYKVPSDMNFALEQLTEDRKFNIVTFGISESTSGTPKHIWDSDQISPQMSLIFRD